MLLHIDHGKMMQESWKIMELDSGKVLGTLEE